MAKKQAKQEDIRAVIETKAQESYIRLRAIIQALKSCDREQLKKAL